MKNKENETFRCILSVILGLCLGMISVVIILTVNQRQTASGVTPVLFCLLTMALLCCMDFTWKIGMNLFLVEITASILLTVMLGIYVYTCAFNQATLLQMGKELVLPSLVSSGLNAVRLYLRKGRVEKE